MTALRESGDRARRASDAALAAILLAVAPRELGGASIRLAAGSVAEAWIDLAVPEVPGRPRPVRLPIGLTNEQLAGGVDLAATLAVGRKVMQPGLIERNKGCALIVPSAERWSAEAAACLVGRIDQRCDADADGPTEGHLLLALDEGCGEDERPPELLCDRLAFLIDLAGLREADVAGPTDLTDRLEAARALHPNVAV
ncbi:MAG TPA: hypothetical protein PK264_04175, partial [Hyphomicrobiaceae bacterium]|nr:hypothetical protein [Hyphomicrobiaceae bacterium]